MIKCKEFDQDEWVDRFLGAGKRIYTKEEVVEKVLKFASSVDVVSISHVVHAGGETLENNFYTVWYGEQI